MDTSQTESSVRHLEERVENQVKEASRRAHQVGERLADFVREHPVGTLAGAFAVGYVIARLARR